MYISIYIYICCKRRPRLLNFTKSRTAYSIPFQPSFPPTIYMYMYYQAIITAFSIHPTENHKTLNHQGVTSHIIIERCRPTTPKDAARCPAYPPSSSIRHRITHAHRSHSQSNPIFPTVIRRPPMPTTNPNSHTMSMNFPHHPYTLYITK